MWCKKCRDHIVRSDGFYSCELVGAVPTNHVWLFEYEQVKEILHASKYRGQYNHYAHLAGALAEAITIARKSNLDNCVLTFVPTISNHIKSRGFDHAQKLADQVGKNLGLVVNSTLISTHDRSQVQMSKKNRVDNPHFISRTSLREKNIILIDDVSSTRSTLNHAAKTLVKSGCKNILFATIANRTWRK